MTLRIKDNLFDTSKLKMGEIMRLRAGKDYVPFAAVTLTKPKTLVEVYTEYELTVETLLNFNKEFQEMFELYVVRGHRLTEIFQ